MITAGIAVLTGAILACFQTQSMDIYWLSWLPVCLFFIYFNPAGRIAWLILSSFLYTSVHLHFQLEHEVPDEIAHKMHQVTGVVSSIPVNRGASVRFEFDIKSSQLSAAFAQHVQLSWKNPPQRLQAGQRWQLQIKLKPAHGFQNPGGFDYERWLFVKGIQARGYVVSGVENRLMGQGPMSINRIRERINGWIDSHCHNCRYTGLLQALSTGYRGHINAEQRELLQSTGTAHLIAISGLHIGVIAGFIFFLAHHVWNLFFFRTIFTRSEFCWLLSWVMVLMYSLLSGFELPAQRAFIMFSILGLQMLLRVPFNLLNSVMTTLVVVLIFSPLSVLSESFWLTLCALGVILLGSFIMQNQHSRWRQLILIQVLFSLLFIPLTLIVFNQLQIGSLLANLVAVPLVSMIIVPANFLLLLLYFLPAPLLDTAYSVMDYLAGYLIAYLSLLEESGFKAMPLHSLSAWKIMLILLLLLIVVLPTGLIRMRSWLLLLPVLIFWPSERNDDVLMSLNVLDVGTGNAIVVKTRHHALVYDFGPGNRSGYSTAAWVVEPFLQQQGVEQVDLIIISHNDQDHAGGLYALLKTYQHLPVLSGTPNSLRRSFPELSQVTDCHDRQPWYWDGVKFEFLMTGKQDSRSENNRSCVLQVSVGDHRLLLTGDIEASQEAELLARYPQQLNSEVVLAPHHGSETSSSTEFIQAVSPGHVIFSSGYLNHWRFPRPTVVNRYRATGAELYRTDRDGAIQVDCNLATCRVEKFRQRYPHIWY